MFAGWDEHPPTNILVKAIVQGLGGGGKAKPEPLGQEDIPPAALRAMDAAAKAHTISAKMGHSIPVVKGRDRGLPSAPPVFDIDALRERNAAVAKKFMRKTSGE